MPEVDESSLSRLLEPIEAIVYDFDGVVLESADLKTAAFCRLFADRPEHLDAIRRHHLEHLGISRFEKFRWILTELFDEEPTEERLRTLGDGFSELVHSAILACPEVPGARASLEAARRSGRSTWVASGTPEEELRSVVGARDLRPLFDDVWGSPTAKVDILRRIAERTSLTPDRLLMIGDGTSDQRAAEEAGCPFLARSTPDHSDHWKAGEAAWAHDLRPLASALAGSRALSATGLSPSAG